MSSEEAEEVAEAGDDEDDDDEEVVEDVTPVEVEMGEEGVVGPELKEAEVVVKETEVLLYDKGICAKDFAIGFISNISFGVLQQAKLPMPLVPLSQQL